MQYSSETIRRVQARLALTGAAFTAPNPSGVPYIVGPPGSGATVTLWQTTDTSYFKWLCIAMVSSADSGASGISVEVSYDAGTTWRVMGTSSYTTATGWWKFKKHITEGLMRLRYTNSAAVLTTWTGSIYLSNEDFED